MTKWCFLLALAGGCSGAIGDGSGGGSAAESRPVLVGCSLSRDGTNGSFFAQNTISCHTDAPVIADVEFTPHGAAGPSGAAEAKPGAPSDPVTFRDSDLPVQVWGTLTVQVSGGLQLDFDGAALDADHTSASVEAPFALWTLTLTAAEDLSVGWTYDLPVAPLHVRGSGKSAAIQASADLSANHATVITLAVPPGGLPDGMLTRHVPVHITGPGAWVIDRFGAHRPDDVPAAQPDLGGAPDPTVSDPSGSAPDLGGAPDPTVSDPNGGAPDLADAPTCGNDQQRSCNGTCNPGTYKGSDDTCYACGQDGLHSCNGTCAPGTYKGGDDLCYACGTVGLHSCNGTCNPGTYMGQDNFCYACGKDGQHSCNGVCDPGTIKGNDDWCYACGKDGQHSCNGVCDPGTIKGSDDFCYACGGDNQPSC